MRHITRAFMLCTAMALAPLAIAQTTSSGSLTTTRPSTVPLWDGNESIEHYAHRAGIGTVAKTVLLGSKELPLELTLVPAGGTFRRGNFDTTVPQPFYLGMTHVTIDQFTVFIDSTGYKTDAEQKGAGYCVELVGGSYETILTKGASWRNPGFPQKGDHPVVMVSWNDAAAFCDWLSRETRRTFRLPTQTQWEFAARAGSTAQYLWDNGSGKDYANVSDISLQKACGAAGRNWEYSNWDDGFVYTSPGKSFRPNAFGLYDMIGNAWQWLDDAPVTANPPVAKALPPAFAGHPLSHPQRGASWNSRPFTISFSTSNSHPADWAYAVGGFRVELVLDASD